MLKRACFWLKSARNEPTTKGAHPDALPLSKFGWGLIGACSIRVGPCWEGPYWEEASGLDVWDAASDVGYSEEEEQQAGEYERGRGRGVGGRGWGVGVRAATGVGGSRGACG